MKLHHIRFKVKRALSIFLALVLCVFFSSAAFIGDMRETSASLQELLNKLNAEFGTNFHVITPEEAMERYGIQLTNVRQTPRTQQELWEIEAYFRHFAMVEIPKINKRTQEALAISVSLEKARLADEEFTLQDAEKAARATIDATKTIVDATAGAIATTYVDSYGHTLWGDY